MSNLVYPHMPLWFDLEDEPDYDPFSGDTEPLTPLDIAIVDISEDDDFDIRDCDLGGI